MAKNFDLSSGELPVILNNGDVAVLRTDTLYGIVARADNQAAVERVYSIKHRNEHKSPIVLISSYDQIFDTITILQREICEYYWPGKVSIILPSANAPTWLERGNQSIAYRMPSSEALLKLISITGPLIAPSANPEGQAPAMSIHQARSYFSDQVDAYCDSGEVTDNSPSKLLLVHEDGNIERLR